MPIVCEGKCFESVAAMCIHYGVERFKTHSRIQRGWTPEQAVGIVPREESIFRPKAVEIKGKRYENLTSAAAALGVLLPTVKRRIEKGYTVEDAFLGRLKPRTGTRGKPISFQGETYPSTAALAARYGLTGTLVLKRLKSGWTLPQALDVEPPPPRFRDFEGHARDMKWKQVRTTDGMVEPVPSAGGYKLYLVTNSVNDKVYVGITVGQLDARLKQHFAAARRGRKSAFMNAINKYGEDTFHIKLLSSGSVTYEELQALEVEEIVKRDSIRNGYNTAQGGSLGTVKKIQISGITFPSYLSAAAHFGVDPHVMALRLGRLKWTPEQAVGIENRGWVGKEIPLTVAGVVYPSILQAAEAYGVKYKLVYERMKKRGWTTEQALGISSPPSSIRYTGINVSAFDQDFKSYEACAKYHGITAVSLIKRIAEKHETTEDAIRHLQSNPKSGAKPKAVSVLGVTYPSIKELSAQLGLSVHSIRNRMRTKSQTLEEAVGQLQSHRKKTELRSE